MKHRMGNSPKCYECKWYKEKEAHDQCRGDGWCYCKKNQGINGHKPLHPKERIPVLWNNDCSYWIDAECGATHYEVNTRHVEEWRTGFERIYIAEQIGAKEDP